MEVFPGISIDPDVRFGKPCLTGTRIGVATIVGLIAAGETPETVAAEYQISRGQVRAALACAAHVAAHLPPAVRQAFVKVLLDESFPLALQSRGGWRVGRSHHHPRLAWGIGRAHPGTSRRRTRTRSSAHLWRRHRPFAVQARRRRISRLV
ncbi:MAG: DUF433 domain-containing protein [Gemmatimonadetes bacterium]|nr:DUF433 domain-containing protein [Gemmatimonadota bacterium]